MRIRNLAHLCIMALAIQSAAQAQVTTATEPASAESQRQTQRERLNERFQTMASLRKGVNVELLEKNLDRAMQDGITSGLTPGAVILVQRNGQSIFAKAYGNRSVAPTTEPATLETIYDLASLTKPIATATSIMKLVEQGQVRLNDRVSKYIPEWKNTPEEETARKDRERGDLPTDRESITIRHLLTHTSGLPSYERYYERYPEGNARKKIVSDIARVRLSGPVGGQFIYSDLGFIVLGDLVERISGLPLDEFCQAEIFGPLGMTDTSFGVPEDKLDRTAPTEWRAAKSENSESTRTIILGTVHDGNADVQDGVAGHAGLFSTADDMAIFCEMMVNGGASRTARVLSPLTVREMTTNYAQLEEGEVERGLGWDISSAYNSQKGDLFQSGYGHTGFTGTSIWIDPEEKIAVIILANRVHPDGKGNVVGLRAHVANIVAGSIEQSYKNKSE